MLQITKENLNTLFMTDSEMKEMLHKEFHSMCYVCEEATRHTEIDHFFPQKNYPEKAMEWSNLFLICQKCNKIKGNRFNIPEKEILNVLVDNVDELISLQLHDGTVQINTVNGESIELTNKIKNTYELLEAVYNQASMSSVQLRQILNNELKDFSMVYINYKKATDIFKDGFIQLIRERLNKNAAYELKHRGFISFKRKIIESDLELLNRLSMLD
jgi:uncharacterized protein (TIGR02646 family)